MRKGAHSAWDVASFPRLKKRKNALREREQLLRAYTKQADQLRRNQEEAYQRRMRNASAPTIRTNGAKAAYGGPEITCVVCNGTVPQGSSPVRCSAYWLYEAMVCIKCNRIYCDNCKVHQLEPGRIW